MPMRNAAANGNRQQSGNAEKLTDAGNAGKLGEERPRARQEEHPR